MDGSIIANGDIELDDAANLFLSAFEDAPGEPSDKGGDDDETKRKKVSPDTEGNTDDDADASDADDENPSDEEDESSDNEEDDKGKERKFADDDTTYVKVKVGDTEHEVPVKELKRLWGQEAALTNRSKEVADAKKAAEAEQTKAATTLTKLVERAREAAKPYAEINWALLAKNPEVTAEQITFLQNEAKAALDNVKFLETELDGIVETRAKADQEALLKQASETIKALSDPETGIKGWSQKLYSDVREFAVSQGLAAEAVNRIVDEKAIRLMHMAYLYHKGQQVATQRVKKVGKKIVKATHSPKTNASVSKTEAAKAMDKLRKNGSMDNAAEAFLARMGLSDDE